MSEYVCGTIQYVTEGGPAHSDLCFDGKPTTEQRAFLHASLDEWLDEQSGDDGEAFLLGDHRAFHPDQWDIDHAVSMIRDEIFALPVDTIGEDDGTVKAIIKDGIRELLA